MFSEILNNENKNIRVLQIDFISIFISVTRNIVLGAMGEEAAGVVKEKTQ